MSRGRPKKVRPAPGAPVQTGMSQRDIALALGLSRKQVAQALAIASLPRDEFEAAVEAEKPASVKRLELLARKRAGKVTSYERRCPGCGLVWRIEDAS